MDEQEINSIVSQVDFLDVEATKLLKLIWRDKSELSLPSAIVFYQSDSKDESLKAWVNPVFTHVALLENGKVSLKELDQGNKENDTKRREYIMGYEEVRSSLIFPKNISGQSQEAWIESHGRYIGNFGWGDRKIYRRGHDGWKLIESRNIWRS